MRKVFLIIVAAGLLGTSLVSCRDKKTVGDKVEDVADDMEDAVD